MFMLYQPKMIVLVPLLCSLLINTLLCVKYQGSLYNTDQSPILPSDYDSLPSLNLTKSCRSPRDCSLQCLRDGDCEAFIYDPDNNKCHVYNSSLDSRCQGDNVSPRLLYGEPYKKKSNDSPRPAIAKDCQDLFEAGKREPGVYTLAPDGCREFTAWCDFDSEQGWTVIQRRVDGSVDFHRNWQEYKTGFGNKDSEYWIGNEKLHWLTKTSSKLNVYLRRFDDMEGTANYSMFMVGSETTEYTLTVSGYTGDASNGLNNVSVQDHNGLKFTTFDKDNDLRDWSNCADAFTGGWWFRHCYNVNLNGLYTSEPPTTSQSALWSEAFTEALTTIVMRITRNAVMFPTTVSFKKI